MKTKTKTKRKKRSGWPVFLLIILFIGAFWFAQNYTFKTETTEIKSDKVIDELTFAVLSDLHGSVFGINNSTLINKVNSENPDLVFVLGDMYSSTDKNDNARNRAVELMESFVAPVYFVAGEHDNGDEFEQMLRDSGINVLTNESDSLTIAGCDLTIYGIDNAYFAPGFSLERKFGDVDKNSFSILLAHIPNHDAYTKWGADLTFCGDTHGGLMQIPFCGPLYLNGNWLPELTGDEPVYDKGLFEENGKYLYITPGLGNYPLPLRLFNRPQLDIIKVFPK